MADARSRDAWLHTSWLLAKIHNASVTKEEDTRKPEDFNPWLQKVQPKTDEKIMLPITTLKDLFVPGAKAGQ